MTKQERSMQYSIVVCMVCCILGTLMVAGVIINHYIHQEPQNTEIVRTCWIYELGEKETVFEDEDGNLWAIEARFPDIDHAYSITFDTQGTEDLTDDVITGITWAD